MEDILSFALAMVVPPFVDALAEQAPATCELARLVRLRMHATEIAQAGRDDGVGRDLDRNAACGLGIRPEPPGATGAFVLSCPFYA